MKAKKQNYLAERRVLSGMRASGSLHLGHYFGALKNWVAMQEDYECFYFVADWHGLTTHYENPELVRASSLDMVIDWLAAGISPQKAVIFLQSQVPQHAELHLLLSMITPLSWLERVPSYKEQRALLKGKDLSTYGFLGYPLLQSADILIYRAGWVPVGQDQESHIEITREIARRFNRVYGNSKQVKQRRDQLLKEMPTAEQRLFTKRRSHYLEKGDKEAYSQARASLLEGDYEEEDLLILLGHLEDTGKMILPIPQALLSDNAKMPGLDGRKMSKSYNNTILLRDEPDTILAKLLKMPTDPARVKRTDPGNPDICPVGDWHKVYSDKQTLSWVDKGCRSATIGCVDCKKRLAEVVIETQKPFIARAKEYLNDKTQVIRILDSGKDRAQAEAEKTLAPIRSLMGLTD